MLYNFKCINSYVPKCKAPTEYTEIILKHLHLFILLKIKTKKHKKCIVQKHTNKGLQFLIN